MNTSYNNYTYKFGMFLDSINEIQFDKARQYEIINEVSRYNQGSPRCWQDVPANS
jgi:hypothetical protein